MKAKRSKIPDYFNEYYYSAVAIFNRFKRFGLPFSGGWAEQPGYLIEIIEAFDATITAHKGK